MLGLGNILSGGSGRLTLEAPAYSMSFDGSGDYVSFTETNFPINAGYKLSISFWAKRDTTATSEDAVLTNVNTSYRRINFDTAGTKLYMEGDQNGYDAYGATTADTNWHHYVITLNNNTIGGQPAVVVVYEDGSTVSTTITNLGVKEGINSGFTINSIGSPSGGGVTGFDGLLYQIAMWDELLDADAVAAIYNSGTPIPLEENKGNYDNSLDLIHLWRFNENTGSTTADSVGSLTGTLAGNAAFSSTTP